MVEIHPREIFIRRVDQNSHALNTLLSHLEELRNIKCVSGQGASVPCIPSQSLLAQLQSISDILRSGGLSAEAETLKNVYSLALLETDFGGLGYGLEVGLTPEEEAEILFLVSAWLESLNSADRSKSPIEHLLARPEGRRAMTLSEKIFAAHDIERRGQVKPGDAIRVDVDWIMASELSWSGMERTYDSLGKPGIFRNDRFWLAGDHVVDPRIKDVPIVKSLVASSKRAKDNFRMTEYQGMNYTIMHTEFCRERAQPGMLIIGSDSHTCSAGSMGALAIGLGVADVTMPLITGETWFKIPESINIKFINAPAPGIGGKDTILYILQQLKRNTGASDRVVEFTGPGLEYLSRDARFAISNMTTELGGITGIFVPDQVIYDAINRRKSPRHKKNSYYFRPDDDAEYADIHVIDLAKVESFIARYPSPDDVVPVSTLEGTALDGCFIGACTTAEEDLILGALVLQIGMRRGLLPRKHGKRKVVPGSLPILNRLKELGFATVYEAAGFEIGVPGCSYCVGMGADKAGSGEVWISSQNRNFENRMGKGAIGHLGSAATVAASSFDMKITDPRTFLDEIDVGKLQEYLSKGQVAAPQKSLVYIEPGQKAASLTKREINGSEHSNGTKDKHSILDLDKSIKPQATNPVQAKPDENSHPPKKPSSGILEGRIQRLGDFIDTDALAPAEILTSCKTNEDFGKHCLEHTHPDFRARAKDGYNVVVAGKAFGCGSSRENAVSALLGAGIKCVIARSFAFIYGRNQPNLGLLGITISDESFYTAAADGTDILLDLANRVLRIAGAEWRFELSDMEITLMEAGGIEGAFQKFGKALFEILTAPRATASKKAIPKETATEGECGNTQALQW